MDNSQTKKLSKCVVFLASMVFSVSTFSLTELTDEELTEISGQASIISIDKYDYAGNNFYQVKVNATIESSVNIDKLDLKDRFGNSQIDIDNLSINGGATGGSNNAVSSATLTNPFVEFAFAGNIDGTNARTREIVGIRIGADDIAGFLSFGEQDNSGGSADTGINQFHGYMQTDRITGTATTLDSQGGTQTNLASVSGSRGPFTMSGRANVFYDCSGFGCVANWDKHLALATAITNTSFTSNDIQMRFPSITSDLFDIDGIEINTTSGPISSQDITVEGITIPPLAFSATGSASVLGSIPIGLNLLSDGTITDGLLINSTVAEDLRFIHRAEVNGGGFYLSAQNTAVRWRGAPTNDVAQPGWWMSIAEPVKLGQLSQEGVFLDNGVLGEVTDRISDYITTNVVQIGSTAALTGLGGTTVAPLGNLDITGAAPVTLNLSNQNLGSVQTEIRNCWNGSIGC